VSVATSDAPGRTSTKSHAYSDGSYHVLRCPCKKCMGRRSKRTGGKAERVSRNRHGIGNNSLRSGHEELEESPIWRSAKSGGEVKTLATSFRRHKAEADSKRPMGNNKPFILDAIPEPEGKEVITCFSHRSRHEATNAVHALAVLYGLVEP
jgi:hypothetical protein